MKKFIIFTLIILIFIYYIGHKKGETFENSDSLLKDMKIYISFATIPSRIIYINEMLKSIDLPFVEEIHLNLQTEFEYPEKEIERLKNITPKLKVFWSSDKLGPMSKIVPTLERLLDTNSLVISVDDDAIYSKEILMNLISNYNPYIKEILCNFIIYTDVKECGNKYTYGGGCGVLYPTNVFTSEILNKIKEYVTGSKFCFKHDDNVLNVVFNNYNIPVRVASSQAVPVFLNYFMVDSIGLLSYPIEYGSSYTYNAVNCCIDMKKIDNNSINL